MGASKSSFFQDSWLLLLLGVAIGVAVGFMVSKFQPAAANLPVYQNEETWDWTDWKGRKRSITVHRNVKRYVPA